MAGWQGRMGGKRRTGRTNARPSAELKAILEALIFASPEPLTPKAIYKLLDTEPKEDVQAALAALKEDYNRPGRPAAGRGGGRLSDRHAARSARLGAPAVPRADDAAADRAGARDAGRHRLPAADHGARDYRGARRQHVGRAEHAARAAPHQDRRPQAGRRPAVSLRDHEGIPDSLRSQRSDRPAEGRGHGRSARPRDAPILVEQTPPEEMLPLEEPEPDESR